MTHMLDQDLLDESAQLRAELTRLAEQLHIFATDLHAEVCRRCEPREDTSDRAE